MFDTFGLKRVIEPKGAVPATAWKINNEKDINDREIRVNLSNIQMERSSFDQICYQCNNEEDLIKAKILEIVNMRGKLHNPYTESGGIAYGVIDEVGAAVSHLRPSYSKGDKVICITTITAIPMHIDEIHNIDFNYGILDVSGYAIYFENSPMLKNPTHLALNYTMLVLDEAGSLYAISELLTENMRVMVIASDLVASLVHVASIRKKIGSKGHILVVMDTNSCPNLPEKDIEDFFMLYANVFKRVDLSNPSKNLDRLTSEDMMLMDFTLNRETISGSEVLSILMTKAKGSIYFTSLKNGYDKAILFAESMGKEINTYAVDQYYENYDNFTLELLYGMSDILDKVNRFFSRYNADSVKIKSPANHGIGAGTKNIDGFVFSSPVTKAMVKQVINIAHYDCNVIIQGETGVGKEKILELIHKNSQRSSNPCIKINCATIQENLAESEFFGYEAGAFTGAQSGGKKGYFELANNGILFLDEIGQLSPSLQSKLLRVIQEGSFYRIAGIKPIDVNVRVICANNIPLHTLVEQEKFREDLYYRLNICSIDIPPLRERKEDIVSLAEAFLEKYNKQYNLYKKITANALTRLTLYDWPGNVRELENKMHRIVINSSGNTIDIADIDMIISEGVFTGLALDLNTGFETTSGIDFNGIIESQERKLIEHALKQEGSTRKAAAYLNMTQAQLMRKKQKYGL